MEQKPALILAVDDEGKNLSLMEATLVPLGYRVITAKNGAKAVERAREHLPDVILLDVMMPEMDGFEVCETLKHDALTATIPILMITALKERDSRLKGIKAGANDFISKPIDKEDLVFRIKNALYTRGLFKLVEAHYEKLKGSGDTQDVDNVQAARKIEKILEQLESLKLDIRLDIDEEPMEILDGVIQELRELGRGLDA